MQQGEKKKLAVLAALVGLIAIIWGYRLLAGDGRKEATTAPGRAGRAAAAPPRNPVLVDLELLDKPRPEFEIGRNIFNPTYSAPVIAPPPAGGKPEGPVEPPPPPPPPVDSDGDGVPDGQDQCNDTLPGVVVDATGCPPEVTAARKAAERMKKISFIGFLKRSGRMDIFLSYDNSYFVASKGEDITEGFYLKDIGANYLLIGDRKTTAELSISANFKEGEMSTTVLPAPGASDAAQGKPPAGPVPSRGRPVPSQTGLPPSTRPGAAASPYAGAGGAGAENLNNRSIR